MTKSTKLLENSTNICWLDMDRIDEIDTQFDDMLEYHTALLGNIDPEDDASIDALYDQIIDHFMKEYNGPIDVEGFLKDKAEESLGC